MGKKKKKSDKPKLKKKCCRSKPRCKRCPVVPLLEAKQREKAAKAKANAKAA